MNSRHKLPFFVLVNLGIVFVNLTLVASSVLLTGCGPEDPATWKPGDQDQIRKLVSEISDARTNPEKLAEIFTSDAVPDRAWIKQTKAYSFVVSDISLQSDQATVTIDFENHFGEIQKTVMWTCTRTADGWQVASAPTE